MDKYIEKESAVNYPVIPKKYRKYPTMNLDDAYEQGWYDLEDLLEKLPAADVVEVVRCKDCKHNKGSKHNIDCEEAYWVTYPEDYCSYGERKDG